MGWGTLDPFRPKLPEKATFQDWPILESDHFNGDVLVMKDFDRELTLQKKNGYIEIRLSQFAWRMLADNSL